MGNRPIKIKRNSSVSGKKRQRMALIKRVLGIAFAVAGLFAIGFFGAPAVMELITNLTVKNSHSIQSQIEAQPTPSPQESTNPSDEVVNTEENSVYANVAQTSLLTEEAIRQTAQQLKNENVDTAVVTLKDNRGYIYYNTQTEIGKNALSTTILDVKTIDSIFEEYGISLAVRLYAFEDSMALVTNRDVAVKYIGTDYIWLDTSEELGGKPWANPANSDMQDYMYALAQEVIDLGADKLIFASVQLPTGYSLDKRDFGVSEDQLKAQLQGFIKTMQTKTSAKSVTSFFEFDINGILGVDYAQYMMLPQQLGASNIIVTGTAEKFEGQNLKQIADNLKNNYDAENVGFYITDGTLTQETAADNSYFVK